MVLLHYHYSDAMGGVAHSLKEVCDNPKKQYESLEADVYYKFIEFPMGPKKMDQKEVM